VALALERRKTGLDVVTLGALMERHKQLCQAHKLDCPHFSALLDIAVRWSACRVTIAEPACRGVLMKVYLNCSDADVWHALEEDTELPWMKDYGPEAVTVVRPNAVVPQRTQPPRGALGARDANAGGEAAKE